MRILVVSTTDQGGGAERVAYDLLRSYRSHGHDARMLVSLRKMSSDVVSEVDAYAHTSLWSFVCRHLDREIRRLPSFRGRFRIIRWLRRWAWPVRWADYLRGIEDFNYPTTQKILDDSHWTPDVIHLHNIHGDFFDLRALTGLSEQVPVVWTLHDMWSITGHCGYSIDCQRWLSGCGECPDLQRSPPILRDGTSQNWTRKKRVYRQSQFHVATPSSWLAELVSRSILSPRSCRVIPYGVDLDVYHPTDRLAIRQELGFEVDSFICLFAVATGNQTNPYKDYKTVAEAVASSLVELDDVNVQLVCLGDISESNRDPRYRYTGYISDPDQIAKYYQAADVLLHAASVDNFPCVVLESLACGTPVIATSVGGVPEQISEGVNGFLIPARDSRAMADRIIYLARHAEVSAQMRAEAANHARIAFSLTRHAGDYLHWFESLIESYAGGERVNIGERSHGIG